MGAVAACLLHANRYIRLALYTAHSPGGFLRDLALKGMCVVACTMRAQHVYLALRVLRPTSSFSPGSFQIEGFGVSFVFFGTGTRRLMDCGRRRLDSSGDIAPAKGRGWHPTPAPRRR